MEIREISGCPTANRRRMMALKSGIMLMQCFALRQTPIADKWGENMANKFETILEQDTDIFSALPVTEWRGRFDFDFEPPEEK